MPALFFDAIGCYWKSLMKHPKSKNPAWLDHVLYYAVRQAMAVVLTPGIRPATRAGRWAGGKFAKAPFNRKRLRRAVDNLAVAFPEWEPQKHEEYGIKSYEHLFALGAELAYAPRLLSNGSWRQHVKLGNLDEAVRTLLNDRPCLLITGHCGNWELLGYTVAMLGFPLHALYRPMDSKPLDAWVRRSREAHGLKLVDKFGAVRQLPEMVRNGAPVGFVADQNGGDRGVFVPFFNRLTSTYKSIGLLAMQFDATVVCGCATRRTDLGVGADDFQYQMNILDVIEPADWKSQPDALFFLTARYRRAMEVMVRSAPDQYLWMHRIWRSRPRHERLDRPFPAQLREKLLTLPWITEDDLSQIEEHSIRDTRTLARTGQSRLS